MMTRAEADREARRLWPGRGAVRCRQPHHGAPFVYEVGEELGPLGRFVMRGQSYGGWDAAFADAARRGNKGS